MGEGYENQCMMSFNIPSAMWGVPPASAPRSTYAKGRSSTQASLSGSLGNSPRQATSLYGSTSRGPGRALQQHRRVASTTRASAVALNAGLSKGTGYRQENLGAMGTIVLHPGGGDELHPDPGRNPRHHRSQGRPGAYVSNDAGTRIAGQWLRRVAGCPRIGRPEW